MLEGSFGEVGCASTDFFFGEAEGEGCMVFKSMRHIRHQAGAVLEVRSRPFRRSI